MQAPGRWSDSRHHVQDVGPVASFDESTIMSFNARREFIRLHQFAVFDQAVSHHEIEHLDDARRINRLVAAKAGLVQGRCGSRKSISVIARFFSSNFLSPKAFERGAGRFVDDLLQRRCRKRAGVVACVTSLWASDATGATRAQSKQATRAMSGSFLALTSFFLLPFTNKKSAQLRLMNEVDNERVGEVYEEAADDRHDRENCAALDGIFRSMLPCWQRHWGVDAEAETDVAARRHRRFVVAAPIKRKVTSTA